MSEVQSGHYPIEHREGEIERLRVQGEAMAPGAETMLDLIGVGPGWKCIDIGCGPGGITGLMSKRVGKTGRVVGLDGDEGFIAHARRSAAENTEFVVGNAYSSNLPSNTFDLVHMRFVASTAGAPETLLKEASRLARPGGTVALQEVDMSLLNCYPPHPAFDHLKTALEGAFFSVGADIHLGQKLYAVMRHSGLQDVQYHPFIVGVRSCDPLHDYLPSTVESLRGTILGRGLMSAEELAKSLAECRAHIAKPDTVFTTYLVAQVWGKVVK